MAEEEKKDSKSKIIIIVLIVLVVLLAGGAVIFIVLGSFFQSGSKLVSDCVRESGEREGKKSCYYRKKC